MGKESRTARARAFWRAVVDEQQQSGKSVRAFCRDRGVGEHSFHMWRKRLAEPTPAAPVRFALVERHREGAEPLGAAGQTIELALVSGERLRIPVPAGELAGTLHTLLSQLRTSVDRRP